MWVPSRFYSHEMMKAVKQSCYRTHWYSNGRSIILSIDCVKSIVSITVLLWPAPSLVMMTDLPAFELYPVSLTQRGVMVRTSRGRRTTQGRRKQRKKEALWAAVLLPRKQWLAADFAKSYQLAGILYTHVSFSWKLPHFFLAISYGNPNECKNGDEKLANSW